MKGPLEHLDEIPVTAVIVVAYATLLLLTNPFQPEQFARALDHYGWLTPHLVANGEAWRLLSAAFLHGGVLHIVFNLSMLFAVGPGLERTLGSVRFAVLYLVAAVGGHLGVCLLYDVHQPVVGGSGALFGMLGAAVALNMRSGRHMLAFLEFEGPRRLLGMIFANLVIGFLLPMISNTAHIGGLLAGFLVTLLWLRPGESTPALRRWRLASTALFASLLFASLVPVTRYDWLTLAAERANKDRRLALSRAMVMSIDGRRTVDDDFARGAQASHAELLRLYEQERRR